MRGWLAALSHRNFRLIWLGLFASFTGSFMQNAALLWHVSLLVPPERRGFALGLVGLAKVSPIVVFSIIAGVLADAWDRRKLMVITQTLSVVVASTLAALTFAGLRATWPIYLLAALGAAVGAFDLPARQALVPTLVPRRHLPNAIGLNSIMLQAASIAGPAAGAVIAVAGVGWVYVVNALSFGAVIVAVLRMRDVPAPATGSAAPGSVSWPAALEGMRFVFHQPLMRSTMLLDFVVTFFASATALLPIFAQDILHVGAQGYGWLFAAPAIGSFITSAAMVPLIESIDRRGAALLWAIVGHGVGTVVFGLSRSFWLTFACLAMVGATDTVSAVIPNIIRQLETPDRLRGRMTGINMVFFQGRPAAWRTGSRDRGQLLGRAAFRGQRWDWLSAGHRVGRLGDADGSPLPAKLRDRGN